MKARGLMPLTGHKAGENTVMNPARFEVGLQMTEAATNTQTGMDKTVEELAEMTLNPDDVSEIVITAQDSNLRFDEPNDHLGEDRVMLGNHSGLDQSQ